MHMKRKKKKKKNKKRRKKERTLKRTICIKLASIYLRRYHEPPESHPCTAGTLLLAI